MGADNSKSEQRSQEYTDIAVAQALEKQRLMYEAKCEQLKKSQTHTANTSPQYQNSINMGQMTNNNTTATATYPSNTQFNRPLYPNLQPMHNHNVPTPLHYVHPSTSYYQRTSNVQCQPSVPLACAVPLASTAPTAPSAPTSPHSSTVQSVDNRRPQQPTSIRNAPQNNRTTQRLVDCVTCSNALGLNIYQCRNGHSSCRECRLKNARCGVCSNFITDMRNIALETTIADAKFNQTNNNNERIKCTYSNDGCCLSFKQNELDGHLKECPYKLMTCPLKEVYGTCNWKGKLNQIVDHFNDCHQEHRVADVDKEMTLLNIAFNHKVVYVVNIGNFIFLVHIQIGDQKAVYMTVQLLGTKVSASKWTYELHVYSKRNPQRKYQFIDVCHSNSEPLKDIFKDNKCAVLSSDYARTFLDSNQLFYKFLIKRDSVKKNKEKC